MILFDFLPVEGYPFFFEIPMDILFGIFGGLDPVGRATRLLLVLQESIDIRGEQSSFFRLCIGWCPSSGIPRIFWGLGIPVLPLSEVREYTKSRSWFDLRQNTRREMDSLFRRRSDTMGTLTFRSIYRVTQGDTVHEEVIFALWRFRSTGRFLWSLTLLPPGVLRGTCRSCWPRGIRRWSPRTLSFHLLSSYNTVDSRWSYRRRNSLVDPICPWCLNSGDSV